jgi:hypothetical protein
MNLNRLRSERRHPEDPGGGCLRAARAVAPRRVSARLSRRERERQHRLAKAVCSNAVGTAESPQGGRFLGGIRAGAGAELYDEAYFWATQQGAEMDRVMSPVNIPGTAGLARARGQPITSLEAYDAGCGGVIACAVGPSRATRRPASLRTGVVHRPDLPTVVSRPR